MILEGDSAVEAGLVERGVVASQGIAEITEIAETVGEDEEAAMGVKTMSSMAAAGIEEASTERDFNHTLLNP